MKKVISVLMVLCLLLPACALAQEEKVLNLFTWYGYIDDDTLAAFTAETGIKVNFATFGKNEDMLSKLQMNGGSEYDLVIASDYALQILRTQGLIQKLNKDLLTNYGNLKPAYLGQYYDPENEYVVPYTAGTPLIIYNPDMVDIEITGYGDLWDPSLADELVLLDDARVMIGFVLMTLGYSMNETDPAILAQAKEKLFTLWPNIRALDYDTPYTTIASGEAAVGIMFTTFLQYALDQNPNLKIVQPKEGMGFGIDGLVIPANAPHAENAHALIDYLLRPEVAANTVLMQYYRTPVAAAEALLPEYLVSGPAFVPDDMIPQMQFVKDVGDAAQLYQEIWLEFTQQ